jgi:AcrR family transcriptional regulator
MVQKQPKRIRGRPRAYDPDQALAQVMSVFWHSGFAGTSLDDLSAATGMNRPSLYGAFGDKRALYLKTLERYVAGGEQGLRAALNEPGSVDAALRRVYDRALALYLPEGGAPRGCFLITTAGTVAIEDPEARALLNGSLSGFDRAFEDRLRQARECGELDAAIEPALLAKIASALLHTLAVRSRAGDSRAALEATVDAGVRLICGRP